MIQKLKDTQNYRSFLDTRTGDIIMQCALSSGFMFGYSESGYWEAIVRGDNHTVDARHIHHKRQITRFLRSYTQDAVETLSEGKLDGILRDFASADKRDPIGRRSWENRRNPNVI